MSSYGSISAMLTSLKNNKIPKREKKLGHLEYVKGVPIGKALKYKNKLSIDEMKLFQEKLMKEKRRSTVLTLVIILFSLITSGCLITLYFS